MTNISAHPVCATSVCAGGCAAVEARRLEIAKRTSESVLFIGTQIRNLGTTVDAPDEAACLYASRDLLGASRALHKSTSSAF